MTLSNQPYGAFASPRRKTRRPSSEWDAELNREGAERMRDEKKIEARKMMKELKINKLVNSDFYITNKSFPFLLTKSGFTMSVSHFYPEKNLAIDTFYQWGPEEEKEAALKIKQFEGSGIRYEFLHPTKDLIGV